MSHLQYNVPLMNNPTDFRYTLCFLTRGEDILMLHRRNPPNQGLWNGVGGHLEPGESPRECMLREIREETGYALAEVRFAGLLTWDGFEIPSGGLYIFTAEAPTGEPQLCAEGELAWKPRGWVFSSPEVVSNIHIFGPQALCGGSPRVYHFSYNDGKIANHYTRPLSQEADVA
jgi:8-oxo-dGTP diphosphatase